MNDWLWGYLLGRKNERRRRARALAGLRYQVEQEVRAEYGLPLTAPTPIRPDGATRRTPQDRRRTLARTRRVARRVVVWGLVLLVVLVLVILAYSVAYGVQHHLIYPLPRR